MVSFNALRPRSLTWLLAMPAAVATALVSSVVVAQTPSPADPDAGLQQLEPVTPANPSLPAPNVTPSNPDDLRPLAQDGSLLSVRSGQRMLEEARAAAAVQNYDLAVRRLQEARQVFNQLSNFYQELFNSFTAIDNRIADSQRRSALETAQLRDEATYQLALVHRAQNKPDLAVPLLVQIVRSQNPTRDLGQRAYRQLYELGFVDSPFPRNQDPASTSTAPRQ
ncbi:hypothetical protein [Thermoleptolyngbya sp. C42_A2020_037]|uniref:hypothetical protein n=1 Tax=Thermoleptolyngbya sp. C42_A2020_037 TaxID=2747799 RepID=UPI0019DD74E4|nr:hypothetical protein [Thermoleptolyngbya sp. C42_A2020_037]MBF2086173.1 hypothetical protein [Thermoleptolyngbya sp. C42_A2020_037]